MAPGLASLRKKSSILDIFTQSTDFPQPEEEPIQDAPRKPTAPTSFQQNIKVARRTSFAPTAALDSRRTSLQSLASRPQSQQGPIPRVRPDFARLRMRHASDPQLSTRFRDDQKYEQDASRPPSPTGAPGMATTSASFTLPKARLTHAGFEAPIVAYSSVKDVSERRSFNPFSSRSKSYTKKLRESTSSNVSTGDRKSFSTWSAGQSRPTSASLERAPSRLQGERTMDTLPVPQPSPSTRSERPTSRPSTSSFFRRKKKADEPLFPLPPKLGPPPVQFNQPSSNSPAKSPTPSHYGSPSKASSVRSTPHRTWTSERPAVSLASSNGALVASSMNLAAPATGLFRQDSTSSAPTSPAAIAPGVGRRLRERSGTSTSIGSRLEEDSNANTLASGRNSTTSISVGRNSIAGLRSLTSRLRHGSEPMTPRYGTPAGFSSHTSSFAMSRDNLVLPERVEGESAGKYYSRVEEVIPKRAIALLLSKSADAFNVDVLRSLLRTFKFYEEPLDISLRKFLWEMDISGEAQQIERIIDAFAERYQECNPHIFDDFEQVSFISFSLVILHSDLYNKNNKHKMQRHEYQKNSGGHGIEDEILGYLYDNIQYTEFIQQEVNEEDSDGKGRPKLRRFRSRAHTGTSDSRSDPYEFIIDPELKLDVLRPSLKNVLNLDDTYNYLGPHGRIDIAKIREAFARPGILHLISARSRPEAYASASTTSNPLEASQGQGVVEISVVKIGIIWRKDPKKRKTQRPWQPWIALLTQSQLYIFRNSGWIRNLLEKWEAHQKHPERRLVMTPYIEDFKPDLSVRTVNAVALFDSSYDRHKNAFVLSRRDDSFEEIFLADNESDLHDWLGKINCASTFTTANISLLPIQQSISMSQRRQSQDPFYDLGLTLNSESASILNDARAAAMSTRRNAIEEELVHAKEKLEDQLRNARHLQILAPFPSKSRSELLAFGARISHRIRWARYEMWRLQCYKDVIVLVASFEALGQLDNNTAVPAIRDSPRVSTKAFGLSRLNSKGSMFSNSPKTAKTTKDSPRVSVQSSLGKTNSEHLTTEPTAQRPISTAGSTSTSAASQLPSLRLESASLNWERRLSGRLSDRPMSSGGESLARKVSTISTASGLERSDIDSTKELPATPTHGPSVDDESKDEVTAMRFSVNDVDRPRDQCKS